MTTHNPPLPVAPKRRRPKSWHSEEKLAGERDGKLSTIAEGIMFRSFSIPEKHSDVFDGVSPRPPPRRRRGSLEGKSANLLARLFAPQHLMVKMNPQLASPLKSSRPLFVTHAADGTVHAMAEAMKGVLVPVYGLQAAAQDAPVHNVQALASFFLKVR
jgi:hypothetical protein